MDKMLWLLSFGIILSFLCYLILSFLCYLHESYVKKQREAQELFQVLEQLYGGDFIGGCNYRYDSSLRCDERGGEHKWCPPCRGRKLVSDLAHLIKSAK